MSDEKSVTCPLCKTYWSANVAPSFDRELIEDAYTLIVEGGDEEFTSDVKARLMNVIRFGSK